jgi:hypothetical protein
VQKTIRLFFGLSVLVLAASVGLAVPQDSKENPANKAASVKIVNTSLETELAGQKAPAGKSYLLLETEWQNVHPKQKVKKSDLEGKPDRTMGVGGLMGGKTKEKEEEYVDMDVPYLIPNFFDHTYLLADGQTYALDKLTEVVPGGYSLKKEFTIPKLGDRKTVHFVFLYPAEAKNTAFQFFDYSYGHILIPIKGDQKLAAGAGAPAGRFLDQIKDSMVEIAAQAIEFRSEYKEEEAPEGWRYAVAQLSGKSLSASGAMGNIIQVQPEENIWLTTKEGYLYYSCGGSTTEDGFIRFTPEFSQNQEVAFLVPSSIRNFALGIRLQNRVYNLKLDPKYQPETAPPLATHRDGRTMEIFLYGMKKEGNAFVLDLGIKSLVDSGIEIQTADQFILKAGDEDVFFDETATSSRFHRPPEPLTIPPKSFLRFELAYETEGVPTSLYYRGYESEKYFELTKFR